ncbi:T9SS sorting signal type C domain-containing protein, partial [Flavobacterium luteum]
DATTVAFSGNSINSSTGAVTYAAGWSGTTTITASAAGCNGPATTTHVVTISPISTTATNGSTQTICSIGTATLTGNIPSVGTSAWSVVSGPSISSAQFDNTALPAAIFTPAGGGGSYILRWTITNGACSSFADATITVTSGTIDGVNLQYWSASPSAQQVCNGSSFTVFGQVYKAGLTNITTGSGTGIQAQFGYNTTNNDPSVTLNSWTWADATFGSDKPSNDEYTYNFTPPSTGPYYFTFRYRLNGCAWYYGGYKSDGTLGAWNGTTYVSGSANVSAAPTTATNSSAQTICFTGTANLLGNTPSVGTGAWSVVSGPNILTSQFSSLSNPTAVFTPAGGAGSYTVRWTISNSPCSASFTDAIITVSATNTWTGTTSKDWNDATNWSCNAVPNSSTDALIVSATNSPEIGFSGTTAANCRNLTITSGTLTMSNASSLTLATTSTFSNSASFVPGNGTVNFFGSGTIIGTVEFNNINLSGSVSFSNAVSIKTRLTISTNGAVTTNSPTYLFNSLLQYSTGGPYNRNLEWTTATSGAGYPVNVQISANGTFTTLNMLSTVAQCSGNLTIDLNNTLNTTSNTLTVLGDVLINGTMSLGGDVKTRGNWTVGANGVQTNNGKAVFFTAATGDQTVTKTGGGTVFFDYLIIDKATSGNVVIESTTNITLNTATGRVLQLNNVGGLDLNGRSLTLNNSGGSIYVNGARSIISSLSSPNGTIEINQYKFIGNNSGTGFLSLGATVTVNLNTNGNLDFGLSGGTPITTLNGILSINSNTSCFVNTNPPIYSTTSTLIYNSGGTRNRDLEWNATSGAGYPNDVIVQNQTTLEVANGSDTFRKIAGDLTILGAATSGTLGCANCSKFRITDLYTASPAIVSGTTGVGVEIGGDIINKGRIELKGDTNTRLKCTNFFNGDTTTEGRKSTTALSGDLNATPPFNGNYGGDLEVTADFQDDASFVSNQRAVFFTGSGIQDVRGSAPGTLNIDYVVVAKSGSTNPVLLNKELLIGGPQGGSAVVFYAATDIIDLNGFKLTVGTSGVYNTVIGDGKFKGGTNDSELSILGIGEIGTINFDNSTPGVTNNLKYLTLNRTISAPTYPTAGFNLGSDVAISNTATLTAGTLNLGSANMTIGGSGSIAVTSPDATKMIIASGTGELRKTFSAAGSFTFPIGDNVGTAEYSPATLAFSGSPSGYVGVRVQDAKHPNINVGITDYITRYWPVTSTIASPSCTASFTYLAADENGTVANYFGGRYLSSDWYCMDDVDQTSRIISKTGLSAFGDFTVYTPPAMTSALTTSAATICANTSANLQVAIGGGDSPYTVGPYTVVYNDSVLATNVTVNSYTSGANITVSPTAATTYTLVSVTSSKACSSVASDAKTVAIGGTSTWNGTSWIGGTPGDTSTAVVTSNYNQFANITACTLTVNNNAIVTIPSTFKVTLSGALTVENGSSFTLQNDSNLVQTGGTTNPNTGSIQVNRNSSSLYLLDYTLWSSPVENQNLYAFSPRTLGNRFYVYDTPTNQYSPIASSNNFTVAKGYLIRVPKDYSSTTPAIYNGVFTGKPNSGTITFPMSMGGTPTIGYGFNATGNPYPSQINVHNFIDANLSNITGTLYFWRKKNDQTQTSYATLTKLGYVANSAPGGGTTNTFNYFNTANNAANTWVINVGQGFFVKATNAANLVFTNAMRRGVNNSNQFFRTGSKTITSDPSLYKLTVTSNNGFYSQMLVGYSTEYTLGVDPGIDGELDSIDNDYFCSSIEGAPYRIQGRPEFDISDVVPLQYKIETADEYTITIEQFDGLFGTQDVFIKDKLTNVIHNLKTGPYIFGSESGTFTDRFEVVYESPLSTIDSQFNPNSVVVYKQNQDVVINTGTVQMSNVKIYDIRGRLLASKTNINASQVKLYAGTTQQVLIVKITSDTDAVVTKKVIN